MNWLQKGQKDRKIGISGTKTCFLQEKLQRILGFFGSVRAFIASRPSMDL